MYTEKDYNEAKKALTVFIVLYSVFAALLVGCLIYSFIARITWLAYVSAGVLTVVSLFVWGNWGIKLVVWHRFLRDMRMGLQREVTGVIASIDEETSLKDGLEFRALRLMTGEETDKVGGRLLYIDESRFPLPAQVGQRVYIELFGNYIKNMEEREEA